MSAVKVKKVKPYPIVAQLAGPSGAGPGQILKLVMKGFIVDMQSKVLKVGDIYQVTFELPVLRVVIDQFAKVMKTYDRVNSGSQAIERLAEFHFTALSDEQTKKIYSFLTAIHQDDIS